MKDPRDWDLEYDGAAPPLPEEFDRTLGTRDGWGEAVEEFFPPGAYLLQFDPKVARNNTVKSPRIFAGVLRFRQRHDQGKLFSSGSGDLYMVSREEIAETLAGFDKKSEAERLQSLQFPRQGYRYYLRLRGLWVKARKQVILVSFETYRYDDEELGWQQCPPIFLKISETCPPEMTMKERTCTVVNHRETEIGRLSLIRVAARARHATVKIHAQGSVKRPDDEKLWNERLEKAGWSVSVERGSTIEEPGPWTRNHLNQYFQERIESAAVSGRGPWLYHVLVVDRIRQGQEENEGPLGVMFDIGDNAQGDSPRQGAAIAAKAMIGPEEGILEEDADQFHWTALHEFGHMQGLYHNPADRGLMQPRSYRDQPYSAAEDSVHSEIDARRLWHLPDLWVRPGGVPFGYRYRSTPVDVLDLLPPSEGLELSLAPQVVSIGESPTEFVMTLRNGLQRNILRPHSSQVNLENGRLGVTLHAPSGTREVLSPVNVPRPLRGLEDIPLTTGSSAEYRVPWPPSGSAPELRQVGLYTLEVHLSWIVQYKSKPAEFFRVSTVGPLHVSFSRNVP